MIFQITISIEKEKYIIEGIIDKFNDIMIFSVIYKNKSRYTDIIKLSDIYSKANDIILINETQLNNLVKKQIINIIHDEYNNKVDPNELYKSMNELIQNIIEQLKQL